MKQHKASILENWQDK